jgi:hypothetical protein
MDPKGNTFNGILIPLNPRDLRAFMDAIVKRQVSLTAMAREDRKGLERAPIVP